MTGRTLTDSLAETLGERPNIGESLSPRWSYDALFEAACEFVRKTSCLRASTSITTVASQAEYLLPEDFFFLWWKDDFNRFVAQYDTASMTAYLAFRDYEAIVRADDTAAQPANFSVTDYATAGTQLTGSATSTGALSAGEANLIKASGGFTAATVAAGDEVVNTTDGSRGIVLELASATTLATALFYGAKNCWTSGDSYRLIPQARKQIILNPPPANSGETVTVRYIQKPCPPVYADSRSYRIDSVYSGALVKYAAWLYKYRDMQPDYGDRWYQYFAAQARSAVHDTGAAFGKNTFRVSFTKRSLRDRSVR